MKGKLKNKILEQRRWAIRAAETAPCNLCGADTFTAITEENGLTVASCRRCALVCVQPRPTEAELECFYSQYLDPGAAGLWRAATEPMLRRDAKRLSGFFQHPGNLLDVGCGFGVFLELMRARGWAPAGCDASAAAVAAARGALGLDSVRQGAFHQLDWPREHFDLITFWYVLHHLADPRGALARAYQLLRPGGLVAVRVPNLTLFRLLWALKRFDSPPLRRLLERLRRDTGSPQSPFNVLDPPVHLYGFTRQSLGCMLAAVGFQAAAVFNDGMVVRGTRLNQLVDQGLTAAADLLLALTGGRLDCSISFSIYARKPDPDRYRGS